MMDRKAFAWNWIINGMIIGLIVIVVFASILSKVYVEEGRQSANKQFNEIYSRVNALCSANPGEEMLYSINIPDIIELLYVSDDKKTLPNDIEGKKKGYGTAVASNLCIKLREEQLKCRSLKCRTQMSYIGQKKTVMSLADSILSRPKYVEYPVFFNKRDCGVAVLKDGRCSPSGCEAGLTGVCIMPVSVPWWNTDRRFRFPVIVEALGFERVNKPVEVKVDFTQLLSSLGQSGSLADASIRVVESDAQGNLVSDAVQFQFDKDTTFDAATKASGTIVFIASGTTPANGIRHYHIYFDVDQTPAVAYAPFAVTPQVTITDNVMDEGMLSYKIGLADDAYYYFQKNAGGFSSLDDSDGKDWISYQPGVPQEYRGIPNAGFPGFLHPGFDCCTSDIVTSGPLKISIHTISKPTSGETWESLWELYPRYAKMTMLKKQHAYWVLYEGTPGGTLDVNDFVVRSDGTTYGGIKTSAFNLPEKWFQDISNNEWVYFTDSALSRSLFLAHHEDDAIQDMYRPQGDLTVFGFGRTDSPLGGLMTSLPQHFTIGLMDGDGTAIAQNSKIVYSAYKDVAVTKGAAEKYQP